MDLYRKRGCCVTSPLSLLIDFSVVVRDCQGDISMFINLLLRGVCGPILSLYIVLVPWELNIILI